VTPKVPGGQFALHPTRLALRAASARSLARTGVLVKARTQIGELAQVLVGHANPDLIPFTFGHTVP
jgi:hypothetical protein